MKFETKLTARDVYCRDDGCDEEPTEALVTWSCDFETRSWGLKSIDLYIEKVILYIIDNQGTPSMREFKDDSLIISGRTSGLPLSPTEIWYNPVSNKCEVEF